MLQEVAEAGAAWIRAACGQGAGAGSPGSSAEQPDLFERTLSALTAERSQSVIALAVSVACRSSVQTLVECTRQGPEQRPGQPEQPDSLHKLLRWAGTAEGERLLLKVVGTFSTQVRNAAAWCCVKASAHPFVVARPQSSTSSPCGLCCRACRST